MSLALTDNQTHVIQLGTYTHVAGANALYRVLIRATYQPGSSLSMSIQHNSDTALTSAAPSSKQIHGELGTDLYCTAGDTITVVLSSSAAIDQQNNVQAVLQMHKVQTP